MPIEEILVPIIAAIGIVAVIVAQLRRHRLKGELAARKAQLLLRLSERFGSDAEFIAFMQSAEGQLLLEGEYSPAGMSYKLIGLLQAGIVAVCVGVAFLFNGVPPPAGADINLVREADNARWWGHVLIGVGVGLTFASFASAKLAKRWGVLGR
jgi:hypothetical protein